jgi:hypothetical protein
MNGVWDICAQTKQKGKKEREIMHPRCQISAGWCSPDLVEGEEKKKVK